MKTRLKLLVIALLVCAAARAQSYQVVDRDGNPVASVCVTNGKGQLVGITGNDGRFEDKKSNAALTLSHVAYQDTVVKVADVRDGIITVVDVDFGLPEVEVKPKELAYVQTYYRLIYFDDEGPLYFRGGVIDNTYEIATKKVSSKTRSLSKGSSGLLRFLISTIIGGRIDKLGQMREQSTYQKILEREKKGKLTLTREPSGRVVVSDSVSTLGYIDVDSAAGTRTTKFDLWAYDDHRRDAEARAKGKTPKSDKRVNRKEESFYEVYNINEDGNSSTNDFVMRQLSVTAAHRGNSDSRYVIFMQAYTTDRAYVDKKEYKQLRKENKVEMDIKELKIFEKNHNIPPLAPNIQEQIDKLFEKELSK